MHLTMACQFIVLLANIDCSLSNAAISFTKLINKTTGNAPINWPYELYKKNGHEL